MQRRAFIAGALAALSFAGVTLFESTNGSPLNGPISADKDCQAVRERADRVSRSAISDADSLSACLRRGDLTDDCGSRFRAVKNAKDAFEAAVAQIASACR